MQDTIVVPTDGSEFAELAYPVAASLAATAGASIMPRMVSDRSSAEQEAAATLAARCHAIVERLASRLGGVMVPRSHPQVRIGNPADEISVAAQGSRYVVMDDAWPIGDAARAPRIGDAVLRHASIPRVVVCPRQSPVATPIRRICLALDGSAEAEAKFVDTVAPRLTEGVQRWIDDYPGFLEGSSGESWPTALPRTPGA